MSGGGLLGSYAPGARRCLRIQASCHGTAAISAITPDQNSHRGVCQNSQGESTGHDGEEDREPDLEQQEHEARERCKRVVHAAGA
jgi:hypothetical protein